MPLHPKAAYFHNQGLYAGISSFEELEQRISVLRNNEKEKGDAFEVFAEAYLATQRLHEISQVWPSSEVPLPVLNQLNLPLDDFGIDGVAVGTLGLYHAYQVKFRSGRTGLTWRELSTFIGLADSRMIESRIVFTNCDDLSEIIEARRGFLCIRGSDLDRLLPEDFKVIADWIGGSVTQVEKLTPRLYQQEALDKLVPALQDASRVSAIMACGTGKTLVALWATERLHAAGFIPGRRVLVLLPSLALLRQTLHEWLRQTSMDPLSYLCVCSDETVTHGEDSIQTRQADLDFAVTTDVADVTAYLSASFDGVKIIFSTYHSASVIAEAMGPGDAFDLGIFDEAHKTAGHSDRNFALALEDTRLPIAKRLFMTATPRHYNPHKKNREGDATLAFSMDDPAVYGAQAYVLSFGEAARRDIICGYKVIVSVITDDQLNDVALNRGNVLIDGDPVRARQVANQIAIRDAVQRYGVSKIFTFHSTVKSAASFVKDGPEGVLTHLPDFTTEHVSGEMPTALRERRMKEFRKADRAVMSNARCLTEGVDVPAVDMVAFLSPKKSRVDIVQAIGRAMRKTDHKEVGYVLIPLYVEQQAGESVEAAVARSNFTEVWDILQSLQEQDEVMADLISEAAQLKGRGLGFNDNRFTDRLTERVEFIGASLNIATVSDAVKTRCLENLFTSWDEFLGRLKAYRESHGNCNVPSKWEGDPALASWISAQRTRRNKGLLPQERIQRLDEIGFDWDYQKTKADETWMKWYRVLCEYAHKHGNPHVPRTYSNRKLASWVWKQRQRKKGTLKIKGISDLMTSDQEQLLRVINFRFDAHEEAWIEKLAEIKAFHERHGHFEVEEEEPSQKKLIGWVKSQRQDYSQGKLSTERQALLNEIGFLWESELLARKWDEMHRQLLDYRNIHGDCEVPSRWKENPQLANWVSNQRTRKKQNLLSQEEHSSLNQLGFSWELRERGTWEDRFEEVVAYRNLHGDCNIPTTYPENPKLGRFVNATRVQNNRGTLSPERKRRLDEIGFVWQIRRRGNA